MPNTPSGTPLTRTTFETSRLLEFFTEKELTMQIGHPRWLWPIALVKELIDNSLDACENASIAPDITISVEPDLVTVQDNGPGLPPTTLARSLDYLVRVSDKSYYVSPTRGQLGNALKCIWAAPYVVDGAHGRVEVTTQGERHTVDVRLDRIAQAPRLDHTVTADPLVKNGTAVTLHWPRVASYLDDEEGGGFYKSGMVQTVTALLSAYAACNPHAQFTLRRAGQPEHVWAATNRAWAKWTPAAPTSPHWYTAENLRALIAAKLAVEQRGAPATTVRAFVAEFAGLSGTAKQQKVTTQAELSGAYLRDLVTGDDVALDQVAALLAAMQAEARPVKPVALGVLGQAHLTAHLVRYYGVEQESIRYKRVLDVDPHGLPFVLEVAFGLYTQGYTGCGLTIVSGVNWAATLKPPFPELQTLLGQARVDRADPVVVVGHLAYPRVAFTDRGKGELAYAS